METVVETAPKDNLTTWVEAEDRKLRLVVLDKIADAMSEDSPSREAMAFLDHVSGLVLAALNDEDRSEDRPERYVEYATRRGLRFVPANAAKGDAA